MKSIILGIVSALAVSSAAHATILTFDGDICNGGASCFDFAPLDQSYGDSSEIDVVYNGDISGGLGANAPLGWWSNNYSDLVGIAFGSNNDLTGTPQIFLKPLTGQSVTLNGFDLGAWPNATLGSQVTIVDGLNKILFSSGPISIGAGNVHRHFSFSLTSNNGFGIQWGPSGFNVGIDNVDFSVRVGSAVPEPASWIFLLAGLGCVGAKLRLSWPGCSSPPVQLHHSRRQP
jgi:hypothetical protein